MKKITLTDAKAQLGALIDRAVAGETIWITRRGKPVAQLVAVTRPRKRVDIAALRALTGRMTPQEESAGDFIRRMRDTDRY